MLAGGRRSASLVLAGARRSAELLVHPRAPHSSLLPANLPAPRRFIGSQITWPSPQAASSSRRVVSRAPPPSPAFSSSSRVRLSPSGGAGGGSRPGGGAGRGIKQQALMKTIESYLADILSQGERIETNCIAQLSAVKWISSSLANLEMIMQKRTSTLTASISVLASVSVVVSALYLLGIMTGHVDATQSAKGLVNNLLDDKEITHKLDLMVERLTGKAISAANQLRKFLNWLLAREEQDPALLEEKKLRQDAALDCWASWASTFAFLVMSVLRPYGGYTVTEEKLWLCLGIIGVKHEGENMKLLDILVREGFVMRDDRGGASLDTVVYFFEEKGFEECVNGKLREKIKPVLQKEYATMLRIPAPTSVIG